MGTEHPNKENMGQQTKFLHSCCSTVRLKCCKPVIWKISWVFKGIFITIKKKNKYAQDIAPEKSLLPAFLRKCNCNSVPFIHTSIRWKNLQHQAGDWTGAKLRPGTRAHRQIIVTIGHNQNKHLQPLQPWGEMGKNNLVLLDKGDLASSSSWSGHRYFMGTEKNQWSSETDPRETQPHLSDCDNNNNNTIREKEEESGKSVRICCDLHFDN